MSPCGTGTVQADLRDQTSLEGACLGSRAPFPRELSAARPAPLASPALWSLEGMKQCARFTRLTPRILILALLISLACNVLALLDIDAYLATWRASTRPRYRQQLEMFASAHAPHRHRPVVLFLGDSLTNRWHWHEFLADLTPALVLNRGLSGDTVERLLARVDDTVPPQAHIQRAFVMTGINDLLRRHYHLPTFLAHYEALVARLLATAAPDTICLLSLLPARWPAVSNAAVQATNAALARLAHEKGLCYIDLYPDFVDATGQLAAPLTDDGLHLSVAGYQRWIAAITPYLEPERGIPPVALGDSGSRRQGKEHD
jgi:lysophospholipase L1-like esterase